jgi:MFS family permease
MNYARFVLENRRYLAFGFCLAVFSGFGQTFFLALFNAEWRQVFALSHGQLGGLYTIATMAAGFALMAFGQLVDSWPLRRLASCLALGLALACLLLAVSPGVVWLCLGFFLIRFIGQGMLSHAAMISMARWFQRNRGKAVSIAALGHPAGEAVMPALGVLTLGMLGWRWSWALYAGLVLVLLLPLVNALLAGGERTPQSEVLSDAEQPAQRQWTRSEVIRDPLFYLVLAFTLAAPFLLTGFFFHQVYLAESKGWSLPLIASAFVGFALATIVASLLCGSLIDRFSARRMLPLDNVGLMLGLGVLATIDAPWGAYLYLALSGISVGMARAVGGAVYAELYGVRHLGAIRALAGSAMVFSTAIAPGVMGLGIDWGVAMEDMALAGIVYIVVLTAITLPVMWRRAASEADSVA